MLSMLPKTLRHDPNDHRQLDLEMSGSPPSTHKWAVAVAALLTLAYFYSRGDRPTPDNDTFAQFSFISGRTFSGRTPSKAPSFKLIPFGDVFGIQQVPAASASRQLYALHARLVGPANQHFGCFLARSANGTHYCPEAAGLDPGLWQVHVTLVRGPANDPPEGCVAPARALATAAKPLFPLLDYIREGRFPRFKDFLKCFKYPYAPVLEATWTKEESAEHGTLPLCKGPGGPGRWLPGTDGADAAIVAHPMNAERGIQHIFAPFSCRLRLFTADAARACASRLNLTLAGDSRTLHLAEGFRTWLGPDVLTYVPLYKPYRLGLTHALRTAEGDALRAAIREGRTVLVNSVLHDVAEFYSTTKATDIHLAWGQYVSCPPECEGQTALRCGCRKTRAVEAFVDTVRRLRAQVADLTDEAAAAGDSPPRVYWVSLHKRPPSPPDIFYDWQTADVILELESFAAAELAAVGSGHVDLRWMTGSAPGAWWDDPVHYGKLESRHSLFLHVTLQAILAAVCPATS